MELLRHGGQGHRGEDGDERGGPGNNPAGHGGSNRESKKKSNARYRKLNYLIKLFKCKFPNIIKMEGIV